MPDRTPPNVKPLNAVLSVEDLAWEQPSYSLFLCPECGFNYNHVLEPRRVSGNDNYDAWEGRGDLHVIPFWGECGSEWQFCFGEHKGEVRGFVRVMKSCAEKSFLYFIEAAELNMIKIGRSANPEMRLKQLSTGSPAKLTLIGTISGGSKLEAELHKQFDGLRAVGEWFRGQPELREFIKKAVV